MISVSFSKSPNKKKKLRATFNHPDGKVETTDFGASGFMDFTLYHKTGDIQMAEKKKRNYLNRHKYNEDWDDFTSAGALARWILWNKPTLKESVEDFKERFGLD